MTKALSGHLLFREKFRYKDLVPVFDELLKTFLTETDQLPDEPDILEMFIKINQLDLKENRKPEGYNRRGRMRLIFPIRAGPQEFYVRAHQRSAEVPRVVERLSKILKKAGIPHAVEWDRLQSAQ